MTQQLLEAGEDVVIISRHPWKVMDLVGGGVHLVEGSIDDANILDRALKGADELFWLTPFAFDQPNYLDWARRTGRAAAEVVKTHGIQRVVLISSVGAQHESGVGPIGCLPAIEKAFAEAAPAQIIGEGIGRPVKYVEVTVDQAKLGMLEAGMPAYVVELLGDMYTGFREGRMERAEPRSAETTTSTTLLKFARQVLKPAVETASRQPALAGVAAD